MSDPRPKEVLPIVVPIDPVIDEVDSSLRVELSSQDDADRPSLAPPSIHPVDRYVPAPRLLAVAVTAALLVVGGVLAVLDQGPDFCLSVDGHRDLCYCEAFHDGWLRQPVNALSGLAFLVAGIAMLWETPTVTPGARTRFGRDKRIHVLWALTCLLLGPASIAFHGTFRLLTGLFDNVAIIVFMSLFTAFHCGRAFGWRGNRILLTFAAMALGLFSVSLGSIRLVPGMNGPHWTTVIGASAATVAPVVVYVRKGFPGWRSERWLAASYICMGLAFVTMLRARTGGPWCSPDALLQGHAAFHGLSALFMWLVFEHARRTSP